MGNNDAGAVQGKRKVATNRKGYCMRQPDEWLIGAKDGDYAGPAARVYYDENWLHINTDDYEGNAMLNIEALPALRRALAQISKEIKLRKRTMSEP